MLKKFSSQTPSLNICRRLCCRMQGLAWHIFALAAFLLFLHLLWAPGWYLMLVLFLQVLGLVLWLYKSPL